MNTSIQSLLSLLTVCTVLAFSIRPAAAATENHVVPLAEIEQQIRDTAKERAKNITDIERVLSYPAAAAELARYNIQPDQVRKAVATLSDDELARLADRARASEADVQAGLIVGLLALIGLIVVIIVVVSIVTEVRPPTPAETHASARHSGVERGAAVPQVEAVYGC